MVHGSGFAAALQKALKKPSDAVPAAACNMAAASAAPDGAVVAACVHTSNLEAQKLQKIKKEFKEQAHVVPDGSELPRERLLSKIATRGVVKLFNAVQAQQKAAGGSVKEGAGTQSFLDLLRVRVGAPSSAAAAAAAAPASSTPSFLRDDYARSSLKGE